MAPLSPEVLARHGLSSAVFAKLRGAQPTGITWLSRADDVPDLPGLACFGVGDDLRLLRIADSSLRATARQALAAAPWPAAELPRVWIAWHVVEPGGSG